MDRAIREMNAEMDELFGGPPGDAIRESTPFDVGVISSSPSTLADTRTACVVTEPAEPAELRDARAALVCRITTSATEMRSEAVNADRATRLATCIAECARAVAALDAITYKDG